MARVLQGISGVPGLIGLLAGRSQRRWHAGTFLLQQQVRRTVWNRQFRGDGEIQRTLGDWNGNSGVDFVTARLGGAHHPFTSGKLALGSMSVNACPQLVDSCAIIKGSSGRMKSLALAILRRLLASVAVVILIGGLGVICGRLFGPSAFAGSASVILVAWPWTLPQIFVVVCITWFIFQQIRRRWPQSGQ